MDQVEEHLPAGDLHRGRCTVLPDNTSPPACSPARQQQVRPLNQGLRSTSSRRAGEVAGVHQRGSFSNRSSRSRSMSLPASQRTVEDILHQPMSDLPHQRLLHGVRS